MHGSMPCLDVLWRDEDLDARGCIHIAIYISDLGSVDRYFVARSGCSAVGGGPEMRLKSGGESAFLVKCLKSYNSDPFS